MRSSTPPTGARRGSRCRSGGWDLVLLDWWLPGEDGLSLLQRFRQLDRHTPVLFLTARDAVGDRVRGLDAGADDYLPKPFAFAELLARARALVRRRDAAEGTTLEYRDVRVDLATQRAERGGHALSLTAKEQALLVFFLRHAGQVLCRGRGSTSTSGTSGTTGCRTRWRSTSRNCGASSRSHGPRLIHTLRGRGYLLGDAPDASQGEDR